MKKFKNVFLLAAMAVSAVCVTSCSKDDDDKPAALSITAVVVDGERYNGRIDEVKVIVDIFDGDRYVGEDTLATGKYANDGFTLVLPAPVPDKYLQGGALIIESENFYPYKNGKKVAGYFSYEPVFQYYDFDISEFGVKKGWNIAYPTSGDDLLFTPPSGVTYKWSVYVY